MEIKSPFLKDNEDFFKSTSLNERGFLLKSRQHKYVKRTGAKGNYKYWYRNSKGNLVVGKEKGEVDTSNKTQKKADEKESGADIARAAMKDDVDFGNEMYNALTPYDKIKNSVGEVNDVDERSMIEDGLMHPDGKATDKGREFVEEWRHIFDIGKDGTVNDEKGEDLSEQGKKDVENDIKSESFLESDNKSFGFFGTLSGALKISDKEMEDLFDKIGKRMADRFDAPEEVIVEFLDSTAGRHFADAVADPFYTASKEGSDIVRPKDSKIIETVEKILDKRSDFKPVINKLKKQFYGEKA